MITLSEREFEVVTLMAEGFEYAQICSMLHIAEGTLSTHIAKIYKKAKAGNKITMLRTFYDFVPKAHEVGPASGRSKEQHIYP